MRIDEPGSFPIESIEPFFFFFFQLLSRIKDPESKTSSVFPDLPIRSSLLHDGLILSSRDNWRVNGNFYRVELLDEKLFKLLGRSTVNRRTFNTTRSSDISSLVRRCWKVGTARPVVSSRIVGCVIFCE